MPTDKGAEGVLNAPEGGSSSRSKSPSVPLPEGVNNPRPRLRSLGSIVGGTGGSASCSTPTQQQIVSAKAAGEAAGTGTPKASSQGVARHSRFFAEGDDALADIALGCGSPSGVGVETKTGDAAAPGIVMEQNGMASAAGAGTQLQPGADSSSAVVGTTGTTAAAGPTNAASAASDSTGAGGNGGSNANAGGGGWGNNKSPSKGRKYWVKPLNIAPSPSSSPSAVCSASASLPSGSTSSSFRSKLHRHLSKNKLVGNKDTVAGGSASVSVDGAGAIASAIASPSAGGSTGPSPEFLRRRSGSMTKTDMAANSANAGLGSANQSVPTGLTQKRVHALTMPRSPAKGHMQGLAEPSAPRARHRSDDSFFRNAWARGSTKLQSHGHGDATKGDADLDPDPDPELTSDNDIGEQERPLQRKQSCSGTEGAGAGAGAGIGSNNRARRKSSWGQDSPEHVLGLAETPVVNRHHSNFWGKMSKRQPRRTQKNNNTAEIEMLSSDSDNEAALSCDGSSAVSPLDEEMHHLDGSPAAATPSASSGRNGGRSSRRRDEPYLGVRQRRESGSDRSPDEGGGCRQQGQVSFPDAGTPSGGSRGKRFHAGDHHGSSSSGSYSISMSNNAHAPSALPGVPSLVIKDPQAAKKNDSILRSILSGGRNGGPGAASHSQSMTGGSGVVEFSLWKRKSKKVVGGVGTRADSKPLPPTTPSTSSASSSAQGESHQHQQQHQLSPASAQGPGGHEGSTSSTDGGWYSLARSAQASNRRASHPSHWSEAIPSQKAEGDSNPVAAVSRSQEASAASGLAAPSSSFTNPFATNPFASTGSESGGASPAPSVCFPVSSAARHSCSQEADCDMGGKPGGEAGPAVAAAAATARSERKKRGGGESLKHLWKSGERTSGKLKEEREEKGEGNVVQGIEQVDEVDKEVERLTRAITDGSCVTEPATASTTPGELSGGAEATSTAPADAARGQRSNPQWMPSPLEISPYGFPAQRKGRVHEMRFEEVKRSPPCGSDRPLDGHSSLSESSDSLSIADEEYLSGLWSMERDESQKGTVGIQWRRGVQIGEGTYGKVFMGLNERTAELFAVKQISLMDETQAEVEALEKEIHLMRNLDHKHIVRYMGTDRGLKHLYIFLEYVPGGSIARMLQQFGVFHEELIRRFMYQILQGVAYLHDNRIIHRDIKGANVLVTEGGIAKLADFGCSRQLQGMRTQSFEESLQAIKGSVPWMAPEVIKQTGHGRSADIWSVGAAMIEMATAHRPWPAFSNNLAAMFHVATSKEPPPIPEGISDDAKAFLDHCLQINPDDRWKANALLEHAFLRGAAEELEATAATGPGGFGAAGVTMRAKPNAPHPSTQHSSRSLQNDAGALKSSVDLTQSAVF
ncbi:unnamed protein product [Chrysoparadoxa australica]